MTKKDHEDLKNPTKCWICKNTYKKGDVKVKDHDRITGKYRGSKHQECNLNLRLNKKSLMRFIIRKTIIYILSFKKLENKISKQMLYQKQKKNI